MNTQENQLQQRTTEIWEVLSRTFPDTDIRLQRDEGSSMLQIILSGEPRDCNSVSVDLQQAEQTVFDAVFAVKALLQQFDA